ncbi:hypothetical protein EBZ37_10280 [bacterium]|nr:hypothetical protein [bacterium]
MSAGAGYAVTESFFVSAGLGWAVARPWRRYFDSTGILGGNPGDYWIQDDDRNSLNFCVSGSLVAQSTGPSSLVLSLGAETSPKGFVFGIGKTF